MTGRCETCKWWARDNDTNDGVCTLATHVDGVHMMLYVDSTELDIDTLDLQLITTPDFGCVDHEPAGDDAA